MTAQICTTELNSELVLHDLFLYLPYCIRRAYESACRIDGAHVPKYDALIKCVSDALAKQTVGIRRLGIQQ